MNNLVESKLWVYMAKHGIRRTDELGIEELVGL